MALDGARSSIVETFTDAGSIASLKVTVTFALILTSLAPAAGANDVTVGVVVSGVGGGIGVGGGVGVLVLHVMPHPEWSRIELTTVSPIRTTETVTGRLVSL